jgi:catechol-2,3-dioxygenase
MMEISHLDHLVLTVKDLQVTVDFYQRVLSMKPIQFGEGRLALSFGSQKKTFTSKGMSSNQRLNVCKRVVLIFVLLPIHQ